jgi:hypothetical protein
MLIRLPSLLCIRADPARPVPSSLRTFPPHRAKSASGVRFQQVPIRLRHNPVASLPP